MNSIHHLLFPQARCVIQEKKKKKKSGSSKNMIFDHHSLSVTGVAICNTI